MTPIDAHSVGEGDDRSGRKPARRLLIARVMEFMRFAATGALCVALNVAIVMLLTEYFSLHYLLSVGVCFFTVTSIGFWLNRNWTFRKKEGIWRGDLARYATVVIGNLLLSLVLCGFCVEVLGIPYPFALMLLSVVFVPITFLLHRRWSFGLSWLERRP